MKLKSIVSMCWLSLYPQAFIQAIPQICPYKGKEYNL